jgi:GntR family transcriptional repressor for pyruvate dehydrogenase complex
MAIEGGGLRSSQVTDALKRYILVEHLPAGARLPPERQLATALMAGRNAVREALHSLAVLGIVEKRHGSGVYVRDFDAQRLAEQLSYRLREDAEYWSHILEARIAIELAIVPLAARRITDEQLAHLRELLEEMREQIEREGNVGSIDVEFHLALAEAAGNPVLERTARTLISEHFRQISHLQPNHALAVDPITIQNHEPLLAALAARDAEASIEALRFHFRFSYLDIAPLLPEHGSGAAGAPPDDNVGDAAP